ncbi:MAG: hypothetical protein HY360_12080 [Verrucomicrobia bacterium]|nr:hypothetical protein [Verrucomicrobiota bacterium]
MKHLLIDEANIAKTFRVRRQLHRPIPYPNNPLVFGAEYCDREKLAKSNIREKETPHLDQHALATSYEEGLDPWFNPCAFGRFAEVCSVVRSPLTGRLQMYYAINGGMNLVDSGWTGGTFVACYAESDNGVHWEMPDLNRVKVFGSTKNNIMFAPGLMPYVIVDEHESDPNRRYKAFIHPGPKIAWSADGIQWSDLQKAYLETDLGRSDGDTVCGWDEASQKYVAYFRPWKEFPNDSPDKPLKRKIGRAESDDFLHWKNHRCIFTADEKDGPWAEFERMLVFRHGDLYLGMAVVFLGFEEERVAISHMLGCAYVELVYSRDGVKWHRFEERDPFLSCKPGVRDAGCTLPAARPVEMDGQLFFYYFTSSKIHGEMPATFSAHLARLPMDRFVGWRADEEEGFVQTAPFICPGGQLWVNADARSGHLRVAVLAEDERHHVEHAAARCLYMQGDQMEHHARWQRAERLDALKGRTISLKFYLRQAELFAYRFA